MPLFSRFFGASEGVHIQEVTGSSPVVPTKKPEVTLGFLLFPQSSVRQGMPHA